MGTLHDLHLPDLSDVDVRVHFHGIADGWNAIGYGVVPAQRDGVKAPADGETFAWMTSAASTDVQATLARWRAQYMGRDGLLLLDALPGSGMPDLDLLDYDDMAQRPWGISVFGSSPLTALTGRGEHHYFRRDPTRPRDERGSRAKFAPGRAVDFKSWHGYVVAPGSVHRTGVAYRLFWHGVEIQPADLTAEMVRSLPVLSRDVLDTVWGEAGAVAGGVREMALRTGTSGANFHVVSLGRMFEKAIADDGAVFRHGPWAGKTIRAMAAGLGSFKGSCACAFKSHTTDEIGGTAATINVIGGRATHLNCFPCGRSYVFPGNQAKAAKATGATYRYGKDNQFIGSTGGPAIWHDGTPYDFTSVWEEYVRDVPRDPPTRESLIPSSISEADAALEASYAARRIKPTEIDLSDVLEEFVPASLLRPLRRLAGTNVKEAPTTRHKIDEEDDVVEVLGVHRMDSTWCPSAPHLHAVSGSDLTEIRSTRLACLQFGCEVCGERVVLTTAAAAHVVVRRTVTDGAWIARRVTMRVSDEAAHKALHRWAAPGQAVYVGAAVTPEDVTLLLLHRPDHTPGRGLARHLVRLGATDVDVHEAHRVVEDIIRRVDLDAWLAHEGRTMILRGCEEMRGHVASLRDGILGRSRAKLRKPKTASASVAVRSWTGTNEVQSEVGKRLHGDVTTNRTSMDKRRRAVTVAWGVHGTPLEGVLRDLIDDGTIRPMVPMDRKEDRDLDGLALELEMIA